MLLWAYPSPQPKRHLDRFSRCCTAHRRASLYLTTGRPFPLKNVISMEGPAPHGAHPSPQPKRYLDRFSRLCRAHYCDRQTDRQTTLTRSVTVGRIYVRSTPMRPKTDNIKTPRRYKITLVSISRYIANFLTYRLNSAVSVIALPAKDGFYNAKPPTMRNACRKASLLI